MQVLGYSFDILTLAQVGTTTVIVTIYTTLTSLGEQRANQQSGWQMSLLVSFVLQEHPSLKTLHQVADFEKADPVFRRDHLWHFENRFKRFQKDGILPDSKSFPKTNLLEHILIFLFSPVFSVVSLLQAPDDIKAHVYRVLNTDVRKNYFSKLVLVAVGGIAYFLIGVAMVRYSSAAAVAMIVLAAIAVLGAIAGLLLLSFEQQSWKSYWGDRLLEIQAKQNREAAHDQFNRALLLSNFISEQPDVPFPGRLGLYTGIYSIVQGLILLVNNQLGG